jgi:hypothetical protein
VISFGIKQHPLNLCLVYLWRAKTLKKYIEIRDKMQLWDKCDLLFQAISDFNNFS